MATLILRDRSAEHDGTEFGKAVAFADIAHTYFAKPDPAVGRLLGMPQLRKYSKEPYIVHPKAVAKILIEAGYEGYVVIAAVLHDVKEDTFITLDEIYKVFGSVVASMVDDLSDVYTVENFPKVEYPTYNRPTRKGLELVRVAGLSDAIKTIKIADSLDNLRSIPKDGFGYKYLREKRDMLAALKGGDRELLKRLEVVVREGLWRGEGK